MGLMELMQLMGLMGIMWLMGLMRLMGLMKEIPKKFCFCNPGARSAEKNFVNARLGHPFSLVSGARSAKEILTALHWVICFLWYLAHAARRKFCWDNTGQR